MIGKIEELKVGMRVWDTDYGWGEISDINPGICIKVKFDGGRRREYNFDGYWNNARKLYFGPPFVIEYDSPGDPLFDEKIAVYKNAVEFVDRLKNIANVEVIHG